MILTKKLGSRYYDSSISPEDSFAALSIENYEEQHNSSRFWHYFGSHSRIVEIPNQTLWDKTFDRQHPMDWIYSSSSFRPFPIEFGNGTYLTEPDRRSKIILIKFLNDEKVVFLFENPDYREKIYTEFEIKRINSRKSKVTVSTILPRKFSIGLKALDLTFTAISKTLGVSTHDKNSLELSTCVDKLLSNDTY